MVEDEEIDWMKDEGRDGFDDGGSECWLLELSSSNL